MKLDCNKLTNTTYAHCLKEEGGNMYKLYDCLKQASHVFNVCIELYRSPSPSPIKQEKEKEKERQIK